MKHSRCVSRGWSALLLVAAISLLSVQVFAACPPVLVDGLVPEFAGSGYFGGAGLSLKADRNVQTSYVIAAAEKQSFMMALAVRYASSTHGYLGSQFVDIDSASVAFPEVAPGGPTRYQWLFAWDGNYGYSPPRLVFHNRIPYSFLTPEPESEVFDTFGSAQNPAIAAFPNTAKHAVVATVTEGATHKSVLRLFNSGDFTPSGSQITLDFGADLLFPPSIHGFRSGNKDLVAVAWNYGMEIRFAVYDSNGIRQGTVRSITGSAWEVAIAGFSEGIVVAFHRDDMIYLQTWPVTGSIPFTEQVPVSDPSLPAYFPRISTGTWNGQSYFAIGWRTKLGVSTAYPTFSLYRGVSAPVAVSSQNYTSFFPEEFSPFLARDPLDVQIFTGCSTGMIVGVVHYTDSQLVPADQRGVRRSFTLVTSGNLSPIAGSAETQPFGYASSSAEQTRWKAALDGVVFAPAIEFQP